MFQGGGNGTSSTSTWTLAQANSAGNVVAGDTVYLATGTYTANDIRPPVTGTVSARITYQPAPGATVTFRSRKADLKDRSYVTISNIIFVSDGGFTIDSNNACTRLIIEDCTFDSLGPWVDGQWTFTSVHIRGTNHILRRNKYLKWLHTDGMQIWGEYHLIEDNDFGWNDTGHGSYIGYCGRSVIRRNYVRNKWAGVREFVGRPASGSVEYSAPDNLIEDNTLYDMGYADIDQLGASNEGYPGEGWMMGPDAQPGDLQHLKLAGDGTIYRNNLHVGFNESQASDVLNAPYRCNVHIVPYAESSATGHNSVYMTHMRIYHNTFYDNEQNCITLDYSAALDPIVEAGDVRLFNNIIAQQAMYALRLQPNTQNYYASWYFLSNIITQGVYERGTIHSTFSAFATLFNAAHPGQATGNLTSAPVFLSPAHQDIHDDRHLRLPRSRYALRTTSPGYQAALPLTTVRTASSGTTIAVNDAYPFFPDNNGVADGSVRGDMIRIGVATRRVMSKDGPNRTITVDSAITVAIGDAIWLDAYGATPSIGIAEAITITDTILDPVVRYTGGSTVTAQTFTSDAINPTPYSVLVASIAYRNSNSGSAPTIDQVTSTFAGDITWIKPTNGDSIREATTDTGIAVLYAQLEGSPGAGTVTAHATGLPPTGWKMSLVEVRGHHIAAPVAQATKGSGVATTMQIAMAIAEGTICIAAIGSRGDTDGVIPANDFIELVDDTTGTMPLQVQWRRGPITTVDWSGLATTANVAVAIEITPAQADFAYLFANDLTGSAPVLGTPALGQSFALVAQTLTAGTPILGTPAIGQTHALTTSNVNGGTPTVGNPSIAQTHVLVATGIDSGTPVLDQPSLVQPALGDLVAVPLVAGAPVLGTPVMTQTHVLYPAFVVEA